MPTDAKRAQVADLADRIKRATITIATDFSGLSVNNMTELMRLMDEGGIPMEDRFLDPLVFPVGAGSDYGLHYLGAVKELRTTFPDVHIFGGLSNISFGLPGRKVVNNAFNILAILHGCDSVMIDPLMNPPQELIEFKLASEVALAEDEFAIKYIEYWRSKSD